ncbi:site-specific integrase [Leptothrix ochracea]|uniref:site-specific integrase n=2 Tax=Leptothrix ochracea TaxID=735331 RepID=UPI0034E28D44
MKSNKTSVLIPSPTLVTLDLSLLMTGSEQALRALMREGESPHTRRSYQSALRYWMAWHALRYGQPLAVPVDATVVVQFVLDHAGHRSSDGSVRRELPPELGETLKSQGFVGATAMPTLNTVMHRVRVLSALHRVQALPNPCAHESVKALLLRTRRAFARRGDTAERKPALTREPLEALLATCDDSLRGLRDRALLLFAWSSGGRRRSEVCSACVEDLQWLSPEECLYVLRHSKTNPDGAQRPENLKPIAGRAAQALSAWLAASGIQQGALFRRIRRGDVIAEPLADAAVRDIVKARSLQAGLSGEGYSAHSLRSGFVTEAARQQIPLAETMALTGHRSVASVVGYFRAGEAFSRASRLLDKDDDDQESPQA